MNSNVTKPSVNVVDGVTHVFDSSAVTLDVKTVDTVYLDTTTKNGKVFVDKVQHLVKSTQATLEDLLPPEVERSVVAMVSPGSLEVYFCLTTKGADCFKQFGDASEDSDLHKAAVQFSENLTLFLVQNRDYYNSL